MGRISKIAAGMLLLACATGSNAANLAGDADLDGAHTWADAALIQGAIYGIVPPASISPLALTGSDMSLDLDDFLIVGQVITGERGGVATKPDILTLSPLTGIVAISEQPVNPLISFLITSNSSDAQMVDGLDVWDFYLNYSVDSTITAPTTVVSSGLAVVTLIPLNTGIETDHFYVRIVLRVDDSNGIWDESYSDLASVRVSPTTCGDGVLQTGEVCEEGDADPCTPACNATCTGPAANICGDGLIECGEDCDPPLPRELPIAGSVEDLNVPQGIDLVGDRAYVADWEGMSVVVDIATATPAVLGSVETPGIARDVVVVGDRAYIADGPSGVQVVDVTTDTPLIVGSYNPVGDVLDIHGLAVDGDRACVADLREGRLIVLDITTDTPTPVGQITGIDRAMKVDVSGNRAYVAGRSLYVLDISSDTPALVGSYAVPDYTQDVTIDGTRAYLAAYHEGVLVLDVSTDTPILLDSWHTMGLGADRIQVVGDFIFSSDRRELYMLDQSSGSLVYTGHYGYGLGNVLNNFKVSGDQAYIAHALSKIEVLDLTNPCPATCRLGYCGDGIRQLSEACDDGNKISCDGCAGDCSYVDNICGDGIVECGEVCDDGDNWDCTPLCKYDCSGPAANICGDGLIECNEYCDDGNTVGCDACAADCRSVEYCGDAIANCGEECDQPLSPMLVGSYLFPQNDSQITGHLDRAYYIGSAGCKILDISGNTPALVHESASGYGAANDLVYSSGKLYFVKDRYGVKVIDVSTDTCNIIRDYPTTGDPQDLAVDGNRVYIADQFSMPVIDV